MKPHRCFQFACLLNAWLAAALAAQAAPPPGAIQLVDVTAHSGIDFRHTGGGGGQRYIVESVVGGLALFDYDGDGLVDIYFLNGAALQGTVVETPPANALYRNNGDWTFSDVTTAAGVGDTGHGLGVTAADYDNDGDIDLYLNNFGPNVLYRNNGDGTFSDVTAAAGIAAGEKVGAGACFFDMDGDGDLDLYSANYVDFNYDNHIIRKIGPHQFHPGPKDYQPVPDELYRNNGDDTFTDVSQSSGISAVAGSGMGVVCLDYDNDRDADVFVCNDARPNFLFQNDGQGAFQEVGLTAGVAYDFLGRELGSMGVACGDYDNDGRLDLFVTTFSDELPSLYHNLGIGVFEDAVNRAGAGSGAFPHANWGAEFVDFDRDGHRDLFIACGHFMDNIRYIDDRTSVDVRNILLANDGRQKFVDVTEQSGSGMALVQSSRGAAFDDLDNDGDVDVVVLNANGPPAVLKNEAHANSHWLQVRLIGQRANRHGVGARVRVVAGDLVQVAEVHSGRGYQSHYGAALHFGLGARQRVDRLEIHWPASGVQTHENLAADQLLLLTEEPF